MTAKKTEGISRLPFRCLCVLLAALLLFSTPAFAAETKAAANPSLEELQNQSQKIEAELKKNKKKLNQVNNEKKAQKKVVSGIVEKINNTQNQIDLLSSRIELLNVNIGNISDQISIISGQIRTLDDKIAATEAAISEKQTAIEETFTLLKARIRAMYMTGSGSTLEILLTSQDFSTLMLRAEALLLTAQHDNDLMAVCESEIGELEELEATLNSSREQAQGKRQELNTKKAALDDTKQDVQSSSAQLNAKKKDIQAQYNEAQRELNSLDKKSAEYAALVRQQEKELDKANKQIEDQLRQNGSKTTDGKGSSTGSSKMIFPLKCSGVYISSPYGYRTHPVTGAKNSFHSGTDFTAANIYQKPIYAVRDGKATTVALGTNVYGNYIVIDHGDGVASMYAHCDSVCIKQGAKVTQGQVIGYVGTTGRSTGPHLHFGVLVNGSYVDPMKGYLTLPK